MKLLVPPHVVVGPRLYSSGRRRRAASSCTPGDDAAPCTGKSVRPHMTSSESLLLGLVPIEVVSLDSLIPGLVLIEAFFSAAPCDEQRLASCPWHAQVLAADCDTPKSYMDAVNSLPCLGH